MSKFNPEVAASLITAIKLGAPRETAAKAAGITPRTLRNWLSTAQEDGKNSKLKKFAIEFLREEAEFERKLAVSIVKASQGENGDWRAGAWILERRFKKNWTMSQQVEVDSKVTLNTDARRELLDKLDAITGREAREATKGETPSVPEEPDRS